MIRTFMVLAGAVALVLAQATAAADGHVTGTVAFRDGFRDGGAIPHDAVIQILLLDVSRGADAPARKLGAMTVLHPTEPPYRFEITYDSGRIRPSGTYALRAELSSAGRVLFRSRGLIPVITRGASEDVRLWLARLDSPDDAGTGGLRLPASFAGIVPCGDCKDVRYRLNLWPDHVFQLRRVWEGKDMRRDSIGRWSIDPSSLLLTLQGGEEAFEFEILAPDRLRLVSPAARAPGDRILIGSPVFQPFDPELAMRGLVTWTGDRASLVECLTGRRYPILEDGDYAALEHAYLAAGVEPGLPIMASFDGEIVQDSQSVSGAGEVLVERFVGVWPGETCERTAAPVALRNTHWRILRLGETEVAASPNRRDPSLILRDGEQRFSATVGCNPIAGRFTLDGSRLRFGPVSGPRLDCPRALDALEGQLVGTLEATAGWRITGQTLELLGDAGEVVAVLQAVHLY